MRRTRFAPPLSCDELPTHMNSQPNGKSHAVENLVNFTELIFIHHINLANLFYAMYNVKKGSTNMIKVELIPRSPNLSI